MTRDEGERPGEVDPAWPRFYFNGNQAWGWIESRDDFLWLISRYAEGWHTSAEDAESRLVQACSIYGAENEFGLYAEYNQSRTLALHLSESCVTRLSPSPTTEEGEPRG